MQECTVRRARSHVLNCPTNECASGVCVLNKYHTLLLQERVSASSARYRLHDYMSRRWPTLAKCGAALCRGLLRPTRECAGDDAEAAWPAGRRTAEHLSGGHLANSAPPARGQACQLSPCMLAAEPVAVGRSLARRQRTAAERRRRAQALETWEHVSTARVWARPLAWPASWLVWCGTDCGTADRVHLRRARSGAGHGSALCTSARF